jgi:two-component system, chemotaxis family, sensor kinase Cph1
LRIKAASNNCGRILGRSAARLLWGVENDSTGIVASSKNVSRSTAVADEGRASPSASRASPSGSDAPAGEDANGASDADAYVGGMSLLDLFEERGTIETAITLRNLDLANPVTVNISKSSEGALGGCVNLILSRVEGDGLLIDIEPLDPTENTFAAHQKVRAATERLHKLNKVEELCQEVCNSFKSIYNYNRVMVYRFHEDCHGEVVAENLDPDAGMEPYLNLHYPATDLPQKTRDQIKAERVRTLVDAKNTHADIVTWNRLMLPPSAINLGHSTLRRAHKCHLEYLENMGVTASIAVALVVREQLWGLVIGHHWTPKFVSYQMRMAGDFLAQAFSMRITSILDKENHEQHRATLDLHAKLVDNMAQQGLNPGLRLRGLVSSSPTLMDLVPGVCGAAVVYGGKVSTVGTVPSQDVLVRLAKAIDEHWLSCASGREPKGWDRLSQLLRGNIGDSNQCAGVLSVPVVEDGQLLFLRPELSTTIRWAGDPNKFVVRGQTTGALHPRASFEIYSDSVRGQCAAWQKSDIDAAMGLGLLVNDTAHTAYLREADPLDDNGLGMRRVKADHERTLGEAEITQQETKRLMDSVQAPVFAVDGQMQLVQWNNMCERLTGEPCNLDPTP